MSRSTRIFFAKLTHFFKRYFSSSRPTSSSLNVDIPSTPSPPGLPGPSNKPLPRTPSPTIQHLPPPTSSTSQTPLTIAPSASLRLLRRSPGQGRLSSGFDTPSPGHDAPPLLRSPIPGLAPTLHTLSPRVGDQTNFAGAHDFVIKDPHFNEFSSHNKFVTNDFSLAGSGLKELLKNSMPDAFHDSAARYPPPKCHLGTRKKYITKITDWALCNSNNSEPILWLRGPFGVGKSAIAQSCAEILSSEDKLAATLFFSRSNTDRDDPRRVFTSIAFQVATKCELFSDIVDARIRKDPSLPTKSLSAQFKELLVRPLSQVDVAGSVIDKCIIIIDGLDECRGSSEQCEIIKVIAASARDRTTPFRWFITSRPEDPIIRTMKSSIVSPISLHIELPVSREIDHEILLYLTDEFNGIRESHGLADSWPPEEAISLLVERAAGLWIYVTTIVRFLVDENSYGPEYQLQLVLQFMKDVSAKVGPGNPFAEMDFLYTLIMERIPEMIRKTVRKILLFCSATDSDWEPQHIAAILDLSEEQFRRSCASIQSVMELQGSHSRRKRFHFYHASFLDFMREPARSKELCIYGDFLTQCRREHLDWLYHVCSRSTGPSDITFPSEPVLLEGWNSSRYYSINLIYFWYICGVPNHPLDLQTAMSLSKLPFRMMLRLTDGGSSLVPEVTQRCRDNFPTELRDKIIRFGKCPTPGCTSAIKKGIFGHGENETVAQGSSDVILLSNNQNPRPGLCFCGAQIM